MHNNFAKFFQNQGEYGYGNRYIMLSGHFARNHKHPLQNSSAFCICSLPLISIWVASAKKGSKLSNEFGKRLYRKGTINMPALDSLPRQNMLMILRELTQKLYVVQSAKASMENVQSLCQAQQTKYQKSMKRIKILIAVLWLLIGIYPLFGIQMSIAGILSEDSSQRTLAIGLLVVCVCLFLFFAGLSILLYKRFISKRQKALANYMNSVQPYIPFFDSIMQNEANACYTCCTQYGIPRELQNYNAASYVYNDLSTSAALPLYTAIENYRNHVHRQEMEAHAARQNDLLQEQIAQDKAYYQDMLQKASENNDLLRQGNQQRQDLYNYVRYGY